LSLHSRVERAKKYRAIATDTTTKWSECTIEYFEGRGFKKDCKVKLAQVCATGNHKQFKKDVRESLKFTPFQKAVSLGLSVYVKQDATPCSEHGERVFKVCAQKYLSLKYAVRDGRRAMLSSVNFNYGGGGLNIDANPGPEDVNDPHYGIAAAEIKGDDTHNGKALPIFKIKHEEINSKVLISHPIALRFLELREGGTVPTVYLHDMPSKCTYIEFPIDKEIIFSSRLSGCSVMIIKSFKTDTTHPPIMVHANYDPTGIYAFGPGVSKKQKEKALKFRKLECANRIIDHLNYDNDNDYRAFKVIHKNDYIDNTLTENIPYGTRIGDGINDVEYKLTRTRQDYWKPHASVDFTTVVTDDTKQFPNPWEL